MLFDEMRGGGGGSDGCLEVDEITMQYNLMCADAFFY